MAASNWVTLVAAAAAANTLAIAVEEKPPSQEEHHNPLLERLALPEPEAGEGVDVQQGLESHKSWKEGGGRIVAGWRVVGVVERVSRRLHQMERGRDGRRGCYG